MADMTTIDLLELRFPTGLGKTTIRLLLGTLLIWSFVLRLWFATPDLNSTRFWDERYGLENLEPLLKHGQLRPVHGFHPGFSYLPHGLLLKASDLLYRATGREAFAIFDQRGDYTATTYLICRTLSVVFGTLTLLLVFLIGRRLGGDRLGLFAAFLLSVVPWHLRQSVLFKADIALLLTVVLAFYLSLRAIEHPSFRSFALTGLAIGLALSSKFNAGPVALPLTVGIFLKQGIKWRTLRLLVCAAAVSFAVFLLLQPFMLIDPDIYRRSMGSTSRMYALWAQETGHGRLYLFWHLIETLLTSVFHGPLIGSLAVLGLGALTVLSLRQLKQSPVALDWIMVLTYVVGYTTLYALATPLASPHNWLPISPFAALGAGWTLLALWMLIATKLPAASARPIGALATLSLVLLLGWHANSYVYRETVPRTSDLALEILRSQLRRPPGRLVLSEIDFEILFQTRHRLGRLAVHTLDDLRQLPVDSLNWSDAEVFSAAHLDDPARRDFYRSRMNRLGEAHVRIIEPRPFHAWGPPLVALLHPLRPGDSWWGELVPSDSDPRLLIGRLPPNRRKRARISLELVLPKGLFAEEVTTENLQVPLVRFRGPRANKPHTSYRFPPTREITLRTSRRYRGRRIPFRAQIWRKGKLADRDHGHLQDQ
jgi:hypothetical protein